MKIKFNKKKLVPNFVEYSKILVSAFITVYLLKSFIVMIFPGIENLSEFWYLVVYVIIVTYIKDIFDFKIGKVDYF